MALLAVLAERGGAVKRGEAHQARRVPGRQTDVPDGQWLPDLPTYG